MLKYNKRNAVRMISLSGIFLALTIILGIIGPKFGPFGASIESIGGYALALFSPVLGAVVGMVGYLWLTIMGSGFIFGAHHLFVLAAIGSSMFYFGVIAKKNIYLGVVAGFVLNMSGLLTLLIDKNWNAVAISFSPWLALATIIALAITLLFYKVINNRNIKW